MTFKACLTERVKTLKAFICFSQTCEGLEDAPTGDDSVCSEAAVITLHM